MCVDDRAAAAENALHFIEVARNPHLRAVVAPEIVDENAAVRADYLGASKGVVAQIGGGDCLLCTVE